VTSAWNSGTIWNREHVWPDSRLGSGANDPAANYVGPASDQFNLRPCAPGVNSSHSNTNFGPATGSGGYISAGGYWYPGDVERGDVARSSFYMATRWSQLRLTNGSPLQNQGLMGDLSALLRFHYRDAPDAFERRRNHAIYGRAGETGVAISNPFAQGNRNPFVDRPELVWSVFGDGANDSRIYVGSASTADGSSVTSVNLGRVLQNAPMPAPVQVTLSKTGADGTYFEVSSTGLATTTVAGRFNAFDYGVQSRTLSVGLNTSTTVAGLKTGVVRVNNLDLTDQGTGTGSLDGDDQINVSLSVLGKRSVQATPAAMPLTFINEAVTGSTRLTTQGTDDQRTRVNVAFAAVSRSAAIVGGVGGLFDSANDTGDRSVSTTPQTPGNYVGVVPLEVTSDEVGLNDGTYDNVEVAYRGTALAHANASFEGLADVDSIRLDMGAISAAGEESLRRFSVFNLESYPGFTGGLELDQIVSAGDTSVLQTTLLPFTDSQQLAGGLGREFELLFTPDNAGRFDATYTLHFSDQDLPGAQTSQLLLYVTGQSVQVPEPASLLWAASTTAMLCRRRR